MKTLSFIHFRSWKTNAIEEKKTALTLFNALSTFHTITSFLQRYIPRLRIIGIVSFHKLAGFRLKVPIVAKEYFPLSKDVNFPLHSGLSTLVWC